MVILSQNKMMLINFDNISGIVIRKNTDEDMWQLQCKANEENKRILGKYKTEERAKEVLREIILKNGSCNAYKIADDRQKERIRDSFTKSFIRDNEIFDSYTMPEN